MNWLIHKKGYLTLMGIFSLSPWLLIVTSISINGLFKGIDIYPESIKLALLIFNIVITVFAFGASLFFLLRHKDQNQVNQIVGLTLSAPVFMLYLFFIILACGNI